LCVQCFLTSAESTCWGWNSKPCFCHPDHWYPQIIYTFAYTIQSVCIQYNLIFCVDTFHICKKRLCTFMNIMDMHMYIYICIYIYTCVCVLCVYKYATMHSRIINTYTSRILSCKSSNPHRSWWCFPQGPVPSLFGTTSRAWARRCQVSHSRCSSSCTCEMPIYDII
jgi:hypothetical protein